MTKRKTGTIEDTETTTKHEEQEETKDHEEEWAGMDDVGVKDQMGAVRQVEILISNLLRVGVVASLIVVVAGVVLTFVHHPEYLHSREALGGLLSGNAEFPHTMREVWAGVLMLHGRSVVIAGLLLLIATPVMRVGVSVLAFLFERDRVFAVITTVVFLLLLLSFFLGKAAG